ncbi:unnamed protein product, partial [Rotaria sordida]
ELKPDDRTQMTQTDKLAKLVITKAVRADTGRYLIRLVNDSGSDTADCEVIVLGPPSKPRGPLEVKGVTKSSVTLSWSPPQDTGGKEITNYIIEKRDKKTGDWVRCSDSVDGTEVTITKLKEGHEYEFRVMAENINGVSEPLITEKATLVKNPFTEPGQPGTPVCKSRDRDHIEIQWTPPRNDGGNPVKGYIIERREKAGKKREWTKINRGDIHKDTNFVDENVTANKEYEYRISAVNEAGPGEPSESSGSIAARPEKEKPSFDLSGLFGPLGKKEIRIKAGEPLTIDIPISGSPTPTITWIKDDESVQPTRDTQLESDDVHAKLHKPSSKRADTGKYKVQLKNDSGEDECDIDVIVLDKPGIPEGPLETTETTKDSVSLQWKPPKDNGGGDITGYIIEKCPENSDRWEKVPGVFTQPKGTIKDLETNKKFKFRVKAENIYGVGEPLETTSLITVKPPYDAPDAPETPEITEYNSTYMKLKWEKPKKDGGNPVIGYNIEMRPKGTNNWVPCNNVPTKGTEYTATGLREGQTYEFRVVAVNGAGPGTPSKPTRAQKAEVPMFAAEAPDQPKVENITKDSVTLSWKKPVNDGGSRITGYVIEKRTPDSRDWTEVTELTARDHSYTIPNLKEGDEVSFRIRAINAVGPSEPSRPTDAIIVQDQPDKPSFLDLQGIKDITVRAGKDFEVHIPYKATPKAQAQWLINDQELVNDDRVNTKTLDNVATLLNRKSERGDSGIYKLILKNTEGASQIQFRVNVLSPPTKPEGPLEATNVTAEGCTLNWKPPKDDGGNDVKHYVVERREAGTDKWVKVGPSVPGTTCDVKGLEDGKNYEFRVAAENENGLSEPLVIDTPVKAKWPFKTPDSPGTPVCTGHTSDSITLQWTRPQNDGGNPVRGYVIEKKEKGTDRWIPVNREPTTGVEYTVPGLVDGKEYEFRVAAVNRAGPGEFANTDGFIQARPPDVAPHAIGFSTFNPREIIVRAGEDLKISVPFVGSPAPEVTFAKEGDQIKPDENIRITVKDGVAELIVPKVKGTDTGLYTCTLKNALGQETVPMKVIVVDKPDTPEGPLGISEIKPDSCVLTWKPPKNDGGSPISNYIIEKFDTKKGDWQKVSSFCRVPFYEVTGLNEGSEYKFRVSAENIYGQSTPLECEKPIIAKHPFSAPQGPSHVEVGNQTENSVTLKWDKPKNDGGSKITGYQVEIKKPDSDIWEIANDYPIKGNDFTIDNLQTGKKYQFRVKAKNTAGWGDYAELDRSITLKPDYVASSSPGMPEVKKVGKNYVELAWTPPTNDGGSKIVGYIVEKKPVGSEQWIKATLYTILDDNVTINDLPENGEFEFRIKAINKAGESEPSSTTGRVKITEYPNGRTPTFTKKINDINVPLNGEATYTVEFDGSPMPEVKWFRNGLELTSGGRYRISTKPNEPKSTLTFSETWDSDNNSKISCEIINPLGRDTCEAVLIVKTPPKLPREPEDQRVPLGDTLKVKIPISGKGPYTFKIKKDDTTLPDNDHVRVQEFDDFIVVTIPDVEREDAGKYVINVANESGSCNVPLKVKVTAPPLPPTGPLEISNVSKDHATLSWKPPKDDGGGRILPCLSVARCVEKATGKTYAAKFIPTLTPADKATVRREIEVMSELSHPKLLHLHDAFEEDVEMAMVTEFIAGGELFDRIADPNYKMTEAEAIKYMRQICQGLQHMHENNIVHLDLKPENIMCETKTSTNVKICDFGLATKLDPNEVVKVSAATVEFAAPEIVEHDAVGFYTDMWAAGVLTYVILSGLSPFGGQDDNETVDNIRKCNLRFPSEVFGGISDEGKDFIQKLLLKNRNARMTIHDALDHPWLREDRPELDSRIPSSRFDSIRQRIRERYAGYPDCIIGLGRMANWSSLRKNRPQEYYIYSSFWDRREAAPRFIIRPHNAHVLEGNNAEFDCRIIAVSPPVVSWFRENAEIRQSTKHLKKYDRNNYKLEVKRCVPDDKGEYIVRASNSYGEKEYAVFLTVESLPVPSIIEYREVSYTRRLIYSEIDLWQEPDSRPIFSFTLRPRIIQEGIGCKLICCVNGKPTPKVQWFKERTQISDADSHYVTASVHGVCTLEITALRRTRRGHSARPGEGDTRGRISRTRSPSPIRTSGRDESWRSKLGAGEKPAQRDTLDVEKPKRKERRDPPKFIDQLVDITVFEGATAKLRCEVKGKPTPTIEWLKNGESLANESRTQQTYEDDIATLVIKKVKLDDNGEYICRAKNDEGSDTSSAQVTVKAHVQTEDEDAYTASMAQEDQTELQAASVETTAASSELASDTAAKVEEKLLSEAVTSITETTDISTGPTPTPVAESAPAAEPAPTEPAPEPTPAPVAEPEPAPAPEPEPAKPAAGKTAPGKKPAAVPEKKPVGAAALKKPEPTKKPEEKKEPAKKPEEKKEPAKKPEEKKEPAKKPEEKKEPAKKSAVDEKKKAEEVKSSAASEEVTSSPAAPASVEEVAAPPADVEKKKEENEIQEKPAETKSKFVKYIKSQNLMEGDSLTLECTGQGVDDDLELLWLRNNKEIPDNPDFRRERTGNIFKLVVAEVFPEDSGVFSALLKNKSTNDQQLACCSVIIQARDEEPLDPNFVQFPQSITLEEGGKAKFNCKLSGSTPMTAEWNFNGKPLDRESSRFVFTDDEKEFSLEIPVVLATDQGQYHVTVSNDKGEITAAYSLHADQA